MVVLMQLKRCICHQKDSSWEPLTTYSKKRDAQIKHSHISFTLYFIFNLRPKLSLLRVQQ